jgi:hypothetical protein
VGKLASFLVARGHDVRVLTAAPLPYPRTLPTDLAPERVLTTQSLDPYVLLASIQRRRHARGRDAAPASLLGDGYSGRLLRWGGAFLAVPEPQVAWYPSAVAAGRRLVRKWRPNVIYASALPFTAHIVAARLARISSVPWIAEFRDQFAGNPYSNLPSWRLPMDLWIERQVVSSASACVTVSEPIATTLRTRYKKPTIVVLNGYDERAALLAPAGPADVEAPLNILYTGVIYPGRRDPAALFRAIASLGQLAKHVEVHFYGQDLRGVAEIAARHGVSDRVRVHGAISYGESLAAQQAADVLLLLLWSDPREIGVYTGKIFEYIGAGRPILAVGSQDGVAAQLIRSRRLGVAANDEQSIATTLRRWIEEKRTTGRVAAPDDSAKCGLSRSEQFALVDRLLLQVTTGNLAAGGASRMSASLQADTSLDSRLS